MKPTYEEMLDGVCLWKKKHMGVSYLLSFHNYRRPTADFSGHKGIWCYYLLIPEEMYPHRWDDFRCSTATQSHGPAFDSVSFDSSITWASSEPYYSHKQERMFDASKVGCDYNHLWHEEMGYPDDYTSVNYDAVRSVESLLKEHPDFYLRCEYSGVWDKKENFYESVGGWYIHNDTKDIPRTWEMWLPKAVV